MTAVMGEKFPSPMDDPYADESTAPFWEATREGRLVAARCANCGTFQIAPQPRCFQCRHDSYIWTELPGTGSLYTFTIVRHPLRPELRDAVPYVAGIIELDGTQGAGARMMGNIVDVAIEDVRIGMPLKACFDKASETLTIVRFQPA